MDSFFTYFIISLLLLISTVIIFRLVVRRDYRQKGRLTPFSTFLEVFAFFLHGSSSYVFLDSNFSHIDKSNPIFIIAILCIVVGAVFTALGMVKLGIIKTLGLKVPSLQQSGLYRYTRNPQIVFYVVLIIGYAMLWPSWSGFAWVALGLIICHIMVITEEEHLLTIFGREYENYCSKTPRYIGYRCQTP